MITSPCCRVGASWVSMQRSKNKPGRATGSSGMAIALDRTVYRPGRVQPIMAQGCDEG